MKSCIVVGAGIAGLSAARTLQQGGWQVTVLDKGRGVGGRLATRRIEEAVFDHGAQFITVRDPAFKELVDGLRADGVVYEWCRGIPHPHEPPPDDGHPRYQGTGGMARIAKHLSHGLDVRIRHRVSQLKCIDGKWTVSVEASSAIAADALICTAPVPQTLDLLDLGGCELSTSSRAELDRIKYHPCIALLAVLEGRSNLPAPGALRFEEGPISFLCDNHVKGISPDATAITMHTTAAFSREHWNAHEGDIRPWLLKLAADYLGSAVRSSTLHRWRFSMPVDPHPAPFLRGGTECPLLFAGDAFETPRVEGAALSGLAAARELLAS